MTGGTLLAWTVVAPVGVTTPGIDTLLVLRHTMLGGRRADLATVAGITLGYRDADEPAGRGTREWGRTC